MSEQNIFEQASRAKLRFRTAAHGLIHMDDLWDLPLLAKTTGTDLNSCAVFAHQEVKEHEEISFVSPKPSKARELAQLKLDVVKHIIEVKQAELEAKKDALRKQNERARLQGLLEQKQDEKLAGLSEEDLQTRLRALDQAG